MGIARALAVLAAGFALADSAVGAALGEAVASGLAVLATPVLQLVDPGILRSGTELRGTSGWAVRVSEVCDGHGLVISLAAGLAGLAGGVGDGLRRFLVGLVAIQIFNLLRIVVLALVLSTTPGIFQIVHVVVFPFLTAALLGMLMLPKATAFRLLALSVPLVLIWLLLDSSAAQILVPPANLGLSLLAGPETGQIAERAAGWTIGTNLLAKDNVSLLLAPLDPGGFALGVPVVLAAALLAQRPACLVLSVLSMVAALTLGAMTAVWAVAATHAPATLLVPDGAGAFLLRDFSPPETLGAVLRLIQNTLVHFNLLVLPFLIAAHGRKGRGGRGA